MYRITLVCAVILLTSINEYKALANIKVNEITDCSIPKPPFPKNFALSTKVMKNGKSSYVQGTIAIPYVVDKSFNYTISILKWESKAWKTQGTPKTGNLCNAINHNIPRMWKKLRQVSKSKLPDACPLQVGNYFIDRFVVNKSDIDVPFQFHGRNLMRLELSKEKIPVLCKLFDIEESKD